MKQEPKSTTIKVSKEMHEALHRRAEALGLPIGTYVDRLLRMALQLNKGDELKEFAALAQFKDADLD